MRSQCLCNITYTAALLTHSLYGLPILVMQTLILSFSHALCSFPLGDVAAAPFLIFLLQPLAYKECAYTKALL